MSILNTSDKSVDLDRQENLTKGNVSSKKTSLYAYDAATDTLVPLKANPTTNRLLVDASGTSTGYQADMFNNLVVGQRYNQVEIDYSTAAPSTITDITVTTANGGTTSLSNGQGVFSTGTNTNGSATAVTVNSIIYRPHAEIYAAFSADFATPIANSIQRLGIYNANNGCFVGYEGTSFGITRRLSGADTRVAQASFNVDTLTGAASSKFTRNGVPEALNPQLDNLYRIRYGWLGASDIFYEVLSPDQTWVTFHIFYQANTNNVPSLASPNLPMTIEVTKTAAGSTDLSVGTACWAMGTTSNLQKLTDTISDSTLAALNRSVITGRTTAGGTSYVNVKVKPSGSVMTAVGDISDVAILPASVGAGSTSAFAETNALPTGFTSKSYTYSYTAATTGTAYDVANFSNVKVQITTQYAISGGSSTVTFQTSNDGTNWYSQTLVAATGSQSSATSATSSSGIIYVGNLAGRYFRINVTGTYVSGTAAGVITFSTAPFAPMSIGAAIGMNTGSNTGSITSASSTATSSTISGYTWGLVRVSGTYAGVSFTVTMSDDSQGTFFPVPVYDVSLAKWLYPTTLTTAPTISPGDNTTRLYYVPVSPSGGAIKITATAWTSGTANIRITYTATAPVLASTTPSQSATTTSVPLAADYIGGIATTALPTAATAGNLTGAMVDKYGRTVVLNNAFRDIMGSQTTTISASTTETTIVTAAASTFNDLSAIWFSNTSATATRVDVRDTTAGSVLWQVYVPAGDIRGISFNTPYPQTTVNTNWTAQCGTSITDLRITALFVKNK